MNLLVTGGAGYIGSACIKTLKEQGHSLVVIDNLSKGRRELVPDDVPFYKLDLAYDNLDEVFAKHKPERIFHFAAYKDAGESMYDLPKYSQNITGTLNLLKTAVKYGIDQLIYSSSALVYGNIKYSPIDEKHDARPVNYYGFTKLIAEELINWYAKQYNFSAVCLRYFNPIGDSGLGYIDPDAKNLAPILMETLCGKREKVVIYGTDYETRDGTCVRDYLDLRDLVDAHSKALELKSSETINLGTSVGVSVFEMIRTAEEVTGKKICYEIGERRPGDPPILVASYKKAYDLLGWKPVTPLQASILSMWNIYISK